MTKFTDLISYFENIARSHKDIAHSDGEKHFFRMELDEVLAGISRTDVAYPMLVLEGYRFTFTDNRSDNILKNREGAFMLIDHVADASDYDAIHTKWDELEETGTEILRRLRADKQSREVEVVRNFNIDSVEASLISNELDNNVGIRFSFGITSSVCGETDPAKWIE
jgi:hypothetical protein